MLLLTFLFIVTPIAGCFVVRYFISILVLQSSDGEERADCYSQFVFLVYRDGCVALPRRAMGLSAVCDCGIS